MSITCVQIEQICKDVAKINGFSSHETKILSIFSGISWRRPELQIPTIGIDFAYGVTDNSSEFEKIAKDYIFFLADKGPYKNVPRGVNGRILDHFLFMNQAAIDKFSKSLWEVYVKAMVIDYPQGAPMSQAEYKGELEAQFMARFGLGFIGEPIAHNGVSGILAKVNSNSIVIITHKGMQVKVKK